MYFNSGALLSSAANRGMNQPLIGRTGTELLGERRA